VVDIGYIPERDRTPGNIDPEYEFHMDKTLVVHKDPIQTTKYNAAIRCYFYQPLIQPNSLYCVLSSIKIFTTVTRDNITMEITNTQLSGFDWFQIKFNNRGLEEILVNETTNKKDIIKDIATLFNIGNDLTKKVELPKTIVGLQEKTVIGTCSTIYDISAKYEGYRHKIKVNENADFHIMLELIKHSSNWTNENLLIVIEKNRRFCHSTDFKTFFPGIDVVRTHFFIYVLYFLLSP